MKLAKDTSTGQKYAIKIMQRDTEEGKCTDDLFANEVHALSKINHPNILKLADYSDQHTVTTTSNKIVEINLMALEYAENGEIFKYIAKTGSFAESTARYYFKQLISAIEHINKKGFSHRDIKPENIMLDKDFNLKLADFGFATKKKYSSKRFGTISYMAPEKLSNLPYNTKDCDLFSAAVILFMMVMQHAPFLKAGPDDEYYSCIILSQYDEFWEMHQNYSGERITVTDEFKDLFIHMVTVAPESRLTLKEIKTHPWTTDYLPLHQEIYENFSYRKMMLEKIEKESEKVSKPGILESKSNTSEDERNEKKYTRYYKVTNGDHLVDMVIKFALEFSLRYKQSEEYYRVYLKAKNTSKESLIQVNVLRKPKEDMRCLEFVRVKGSYTIFLDTFTKVKDYLKRHQKQFENS